MQNGAALAVSVNVSATHIGVNCLPVTKLLSFNLVNFKGGNTCK